MILSERGCGESVLKSWEGVGDGYKGNFYFFRIRGLEFEGKGLIWKFWF